MSSDANAAPAAEYKQKENSALAPEPAAASKAALDVALEENQVSAPNTDNNDESQARTVFQDPVHFNVKHPLYNEWTMWFDNPSHKGSW